MNIIFEGLSGAGKSTITNELCKMLDAESISYERIGDLEYNTPIKDVLSREGVATGIVADFDEAINNPTTSVFVWDSAKYLDKDYEF